jgi:hypothetical protein
MLACNLSRLSTQPFLMDPPYAGMAIMNFMEKHHNAETVQNNGHNRLSCSRAANSWALSSSAYALW